MNAGRLAWRVVLVAVGLGVAVPAGVARADAAGPTDYESVVVSVEPVTPAIAVDIIGGDSFVRLTVEPGNEVVVTGYFDEQYLRFRADGTVEQNRRSPSVQMNESRYGTPVASDNVGTASDVAAQVPEWERVAAGGTYVWHDHRSHWMDRSAPPGKGPGDVVSDQVMALTVNGSPVSVHIVSTWQSEPSRLPLWAGAVVSAFASLILLSVGRRQAWLLAVAAAAATGIGWWQYDSLPPETGPSNMWFVLPGIAAASAAIALSFGRTLLSHALVLLGGLELAAWVYLRRDSMVKALLPTDAPYWLDRFVTAGAAVAAVAAVLAGGIALFSAPVATAPPPAPTKKSSAKKPAARKPAAKKAASKTSTSTAVTTWGRKK